MKITKKQLQQLIREEKRKLIQEGLYDGGESMLDLDDYTSLERHLESLISKMMWTRNSISNEQERTGYSKADIVQAMKTILDDM